MSLWWHQMSSKFLAPVSPHSMGNYLPSPPALVRLNFSLHSLVLCPCWLRIYGYPPSLIHPLGSGSALQGWVRNLELQPPLFSSVPGLQVHSPAGHFHLDAHKALKNSPSPESWFWKSSHTHKTLPRKKWKAVMTCLFLLIMPPFSWPKLDISESSDG